MTKKEEIEAFMGCLGDLQKAADALEKTPILEGDTLALIDNQINSIRRSLDNIRIINNDLKAFMELFK